jgi:hypothetical protein
MSGRRGRLAAVAGIVVIGAGATRPAAWLADPRAAVLIVLALIVVVGIGRNALRGLRSRRALARLGAGDVTPAEVEAAAAVGREALSELVRLREMGRDAATRDAAARGLLALWAGDQLVAEEEKAVAARLYEVRWRARRRYPRALRRPIPVAVSFGLAGVADEAPVRPTDLQWSHRVVGSQRAALEAFTPWQPGANRAAFAVEPDDFPTNGPHRLVLQARARTNTPSSRWELDLPPSAFTFEFDPRMVVESIFGAPDDRRAGAIAEAVRLVPPEEAGASFLPLTQGFALRDPPVLVIATPLPCDLAHQVRIEFEGIAAPSEAGCVVVAVRSPAEAATPGREVFPLASLDGLPPTAFDRPRDVRLRAILEADPELAWGDPDVRSLWPGTITTEWYEGRLVRL